MPVTTRFQEKQKQKQDEDEDKDKDKDKDPIILDPNDPPHGKPPCYLVWGRFMTEQEYRACSGMTVNEVSKMMRATKPKSLLIGKKQKP